MKKYKQINVYEVEDCIRQGKFVELANFSECTITDIRDLSLREWVEVMDDKSGNYALVVEENEEIEEENRKETEKYFRSRYQRQLEERDYDLPEPLDETEFVTNE